MSRQRQLQHIGSCQQLAVSKNDGTSFFGWGQVLYGFLFTQVSRQGRTRQAHRAMAATGCA
eukprot:1160698-Pelagomonas_calceolata.AAC.5